MIYCWIIPVIVGLLSALLGYLLGKSLAKDAAVTWENRYNEVKLDLDKCQKYNATMEAKLKSCEAAGVDADLETKYNNLERQLAAANESNKVLSSELSLRDRSIADLNQKIGLFESAVVSKIAFDADKAKAVFGKKIKENDLTVVEGIGPKIQEMFQEEGIETWKALGEATVERCQAVLDKGGSSFAVHIPDTWPRQAQLAYEGKWEELKKWQDELDGGK